MTNLIQKIFLIISPCLILSSFANTPENTSPIAVKKALHELQNQKRKIETSINHDKKKEKDLQEMLATLDKEIEELTLNLSQLQIKINEHTTSLTRLQNEETQLKATTQSHQKALEKLLQATFLHYHQEKLKLLFEQKDWSYLSRQNQYYEFFYHARANEINFLQQYLKKIQLLQNKITDEKSEIQSLLAKQQQDKDFMLKAKEKRKDLLNAVEQKLAMNEEQLEQLSQQEQHLEQVFKSLQKKLATTPSYSEPLQDFAKAKHQLLLPIAIAGAKLQTLPHLNNAGKKSYINAPNGTPVNAIYAGKIVFAESLRGLGLLIIVDHGNGYMSLYGNNQKLYKGLGDWVNQGEMIASTGQSGTHAQGGLYFEIRKDGEALDPTPWFSQA